MPNLPPTYLSKIAKPDPHFERRRYKRLPWRAWYGTTAWQQRRATQLSEEPLCRLCEERGVTTEATVADHHPPHRGNYLAFFNGPLRSLCKSCHDSDAQRQDHEASNL